MKNVHPAFVLEPAPASDVFPLPPNGKPYGEEGGLITTKVRVNAGGEVIFMDPPPLREQRARQSRRSA